MSMIVMANSIIVFASTVPDIHKKMTLAVELAQEDIILSGEVLVYHVADIEIENDLINFTVLPEYQTICRTLNHDKAKELAEFAPIFANQIKPNTFVGKGINDDKGICYLNEQSITPGMYLVIPQLKNHYEMAPFLVAIPSYVPMGDEGLWNYNVVCHPKLVRQTTPKESENSEEEFKILVDAEWEELIDDPKEETLNQLSYQSKEDTPNQKLRQQKDSYLPQTGVTKDYGKVIGGILMIMGLVLIKRK